MGPIPIAVVSSFAGDIDLGTPRFNPFWPELPHNATVLLRKSAAREKKLCKKGKEFRNGTRMRNSLRFIRGFF
jgi:hypothetical protein